MTDEVPNGLISVQRCNSLLAGERLRSAARALSVIPRRAGTVVVPSDDAGHRILGAALALDANLVPGDRTKRYDCPVLLVGGYLAGPVGVAQAASLARSLGATRVEAAILGGWNAAIPGLDAFHLLADNPSRSMQGTVRRAS